MEIISGKAQFNLDCDTAVAIGKFDGIHLGHIELLKHVENQKAAGLKTAVFTFDLSAVSFFSGKNIGEITTQAEKRIIFEELGIDILVEFPLNSITKDIAAEDFIKDILIDQMNMKYVVAGSDLSFGRGGLGDEKLLRKLGKIYDYRVDIIDKVKYNLRDISSTYVREEITAGHMDVVSKLLGHPYSFTGVVESGKRLGRKLGFPTMNQYPDEQKILPPMGVYYSNVIFKGRVYHGLTNIGVRPTVKDGDHVSVETHLFNFDEDMYGQKIETQLLEFKRAEMKFNSVDELKEKMAEDIQDGMEYHKINDWSEIDTILWDIDGTLLDFDTSESISIRQCIEKQGYTPTQEQINVYKKINASYWEKLEKCEVTKDELYPARFKDWFAQMGFDKADPVKMNEDYQIALGENPIPREDTLLVMKSLKEAGYKQYAVTNGSNAAQSGKLSTTGVEQLFDAVFISEIIGIPKPQKEYFDYVQRMTGYDKKKTVIIGDSLSSDIKGGVNAGIKTIWFNPDMKKNNSGLCIDAEVRTLSDVLEMFKLRKTLQTG